MFGLEVAGRLRSAGHDVVRAEQRGQARADDRQILDQASLEGRILVTLDDHFGDWAILPLGKHKGVIRLKIHPATTEGVLGLLLPLLEDHREEDFKNSLVIAAAGRIKWRKTG